MNRTITYTLLALWLILAVIGMILSCNKSEILYMSPTAVAADTTAYVPRKRAKDREEADTTREPITFSVTVEGWKELTIETE